MDIFISSRISKNWLDKLSPYFEHMDHYEWSEKGLLSPEDFRDRSKNAHVIITESDMISNETLLQNPNLFIIADFRGTVINIDVKLATELGIIIMNTPGRNADAVADLTIAFMIMASRKVLPAIKAMEAGLWTKEGKYWMYNTHQGYDLPGKTIGLIGLGAIGKLVAERLVGFKTRIIGYDPYVDKDEIGKFGIELVSKDDVFRQSDFVSLHLPLNDETKGIYGLKELSLMKSGSYLINTSRAAVFVESELIEFLESGKIAGAAIDVYHNEPLDANYPLFHIPNVICTPHIGGATLDVVNHQCEIGVNSLIQFLEGKTPSNIINPAALEKSREKLKKCSSK